MSAYTSAELAAALNGQVIQETFETVVSARPSLLQAIGFAVPVRPEAGSKYTWMNFQIDAAASATTVIALITDTVLTVADGGIFRKGMLLSSQTSDEVMVVTSIAGNVLTVARGHGGSSAAEIPAGTVITIDSNAREENSLAETDGIDEPELAENLFQTIDTGIEFGRRAQAMPQHGDQNAISQAVAQKVRQLTIQVDRMLIGGRKGTATIDGKARTTAGGLRYWTDQAGAQKTDNTAAPLTLAAVNALSAGIVETGGSSDTIAVGIKQARVLHGLVSANYTSQRLADWSGDQNTVFSLGSDLPGLAGINRIVVDTNLKDSELFMLDSRSIKIVPMAAGNGTEDGNWTTKDATANAQDGIKLRILGDFSLEFMNYKNNLSRLHNIG